MRRAEEPHHQWPSATFWKGDSHEQHDESWVKFTSCLDRSHWFYPPGPCHGELVAPVTYLICLQPTEENVSIFLLSFFFSGHPDDTTVYDFWCSISSELTWADALWLQSPGVTPPGLFCLIPAILFDIFDSEPDFIPITLSSLDLPSSSPSSLLAASPCTVPGVKRSP